MALSLATSAARVLLQPGRAVVGPGRAGHLPGCLGRGRGDPAGRSAVVGRDPRASGEMLEAAVAAGLASAGVDVLLLGVLPTPAVAFLTGELGADLGVVISASHNADARQRHQDLRAPAGASSTTRSRTRSSRAWTQRRSAADRAGVGRIRLAADAVDRYLDHLQAGTPHPLAGCGSSSTARNGAASAPAPEVYRRAGAEVVVDRAASPTG